jgi:Flp pilus assembly protein TadG
VPPLSAAQAGLRAKGDGGQSAVELALVLPLVALLLLAVVQVGLLARDQVLVVHAAREAARQAAVDPSPDGPKKAAVAGSSLDAQRLDVAVSGRGGPGSRVRVEVKYHAPTQVPLVGPALGDVTLEAEATMRVER